MTKRAELLKQFQCYDWVVHENKNRRKKNREKDTNKY